MYRRGWRPESREYPYTVHLNTTLLTKRAAPIRRDPVPEIAWDVTFWKEKVENNLALTA